jgi:hypothetical protein
MSFVIILNSLTKKKKKGKTQDRFPLKILIGVGKRYIVSQRKPLMMDSETKPNPRKPRKKAKS